MTTIQYFPSLRDYTTTTSFSRNGSREITIATSISQNGKKINMADFIFEWKREDLPYDYFYLIEGDGRYRLNYVIITYLLINHQQLFLNQFTKSALLEFIKDGNIFSNSSEKVSAYVKYMILNEKNFKNFIREQLKNILILNNSLKKLPMLYAVTDKPRSSKKRRMVLYRGFNYPRYKVMLHNIYGGNIITTTTFLSTSIQRLIAIKYATNYNNTDFRKLIVWKIIVGEDMFDIFNYTFISEPFNLKDDLDTLIANQNVECEFILNMGALLKCIKIEVLDFEGYDMTGYSIRAKQYTQYTFEFMGWDKDYIEGINSNISKYIKYLK